MERQQRTPALVASALLHGGLLALALIAVKAAPPLKLPSEPVSVSIVSGEPNVAPALKAADPSPPAAEESAAAMALPGPEAVQPRPAPAPAPAPTPAPLKPQPAPPKPVLQPTPKPPPPTPAPQPTPKPAPAPKPQALNLDRLAHDLPKPAKAAAPSLDLAKLSASLPSKAQRPGAGALNLDALADSLPAGRRAGNGARGSARPQTASQARQATGAATGLSGNELGALQAKLIRLWNPNCGVEGAGAVVIRVQMHLGPDGSLSAAPQVSSSTGDAPEGVVQAAAARAVSAVRRGAPYDEISAEHLKSMNNFIFKFDARSACNR